MTTSKAAPHQTDVSVSKPTGLVRLKRGTFRNAFVRLPGAKASAAAARAASVGQRHWPATS